jgi:uncharacterized membrane protein
MRPHVFAHVRRNLVRGLFLVLPFLITIWLLGILFDVIDANVTPTVREVLTRLGIPGLERWFARLGIPIIGLLLTGSFIYFLGMIAGNLAGRRVLTLIESMILRIPFVKGIYGAARQLLDAFSMTSQRHFSKVVLLEYPRLGMWTLGFVTREISQSISAGKGSEPQEMVPVFLPTTPNPTSGWMILVPIVDLQVLDLSIEDSVKLIVSGGIVSPDDLGARLSPWPGQNTASR